MKIYPESTHHGIIDADTHERIIPPLSIGVHEFYHIMEDVLTSSQHKRWIENSMDYTFTLSAKKKKILMNAKKQFDEWNKTDKRQSFLYKQHHK